MEILFILVPVGVYIIVGLLAAHKIREAKFAKRADLPFDDVYREHFEKTGSEKMVVEELWNEAANGRDPRGFEALLNVLRFVAEETGASNRNRFLGNQGCGCIKERHPTYTNRRFSVLPLPATIVENPYARVGAHGERPPELLRIARFILP